MFLVAMGILWALQGAGIVTWPADSAMLGQRVWVLGGLGTAAAGAALIALVEYRQGR